MKHSKLAKKLGQWLGLAAGLAALNVSAGTYYWNPADLTGSGTWEAGATVWAASSGGAPSAYTTAGPDILYFDGAASGTVTVSGAQNLDQLYFNSSRLFTGGTINLSAGNNGYLNVNASGTINSYLNLKNLNFMTAGQTLTLTGGGEFNGGKIIANSENVAIGSQSALILKSGVYTMSAKELRIGSTANPGSGLFIENGATLQSTASNLEIGKNNSGQVTVNGGLWTQSGALSIGSSNLAAVNSKVILNNGTLRNTNTTYGIIVGGNSNGSSLEVSGGLLETSKLNILNSANAAHTANVLITGGTASISTLSFGSNGSTETASDGLGVLIVSGGVVNLGDGGMASRGTGNFQYAVMLSGGTLGVTNSGTGWTSALNMTLAKGAAGNVTFDATAGKTITLSGTLTGSGGLNAGGGTLLLSGDNDYQGQTVISSGAALRLDGTHTIDLSALTASAYVLNGELDLTQGGSLILNVSGVAPAGGDTWTLFNGSLSNLNFSGNSNWLDGFTLQNGGIWKNSGDWYFNADNGILSYGAIPEPSAWALLLTGAALLTVMRRRR